MRQISNAALQGQAFLVVKNSRPVFRIEPVVQKSGKAYQLTDLDNLKFRTRNKNISKQVDRIVYGA